MTAAQKNSSPPSYVEVAERKRLNFACEQGVPCNKWKPYLSGPQRGKVHEHHGTTTKRAVQRFGILVCLALLLALQVSAQSTQPTLEDTMTFIANTLNSRGIVSWTATDQDLLGAKWTTTSSLAQVNADPSACSLAWTNIKIQPPDKTVETYLVQLQAVSGVNVQSHSRSNALQDGDKLQFSPDTYLLQIRTTTAIGGHRQSYKKDKLKSTANLPNDHAAEIQFADEQTATRVADAIRRAAGLCGATQSSL
jgi:hypothetical protein